MYSAARQIYPGSDHLHLPVRAQMGAQLVRGPITSDAAGAAWSRKPPKPSRRETKLSQTTGSPARHGSAVKPLSKLGSPLPGHRAEAAERRSEPCDLRPLLSGTQNASSAC